MRGPMTQRFPVWMIILILLQLLIAALFFWFVYSLSWSLGQGRTPAALDIALLALPVVAVAASGLVARGMWRAGKASLATVCVLAPLPLCLLLFAFLGAF
jgi:hypothetical protein